MSSAKINCPHCYKIIELEKEDGVIYVIEENIES